MAWKIEFEQQPDEPTRPSACMLCEALLPDAVDGALSAAEQRIFDAHVGSCVDCSQELEEAQRGAAWLSVLKSQTPEPPVSLLAKILAETTGSEPVFAAAPALPLPVHAAGNGTSWGVRWAAWRGRVADVFSVENSRATFQPRFAMTAAMAFFSIALTMNLTGFRLNSLHADNFTPSGLHRTVADWGAAATRTFQNNRVVYQVEARVSELRDDRQQDSGTQFEAQPEAKPQTQPSGSKRDGGSDPGKQGGQQQPAPAHGRSELVLPVRERTSRVETASL